MSGTASSPASPTGDCSQSQGADQLLCLIKDPFTNTVSLSMSCANPINTHRSAQVHNIAVSAALGYSVGTMILITLAFSLLRPHNSVVYAPKMKYADDKHAPPRIGKGMFAWFWPVASTKEGELVEKVGLDATVFLRFTRMCRDIFALVTIVAIAILLPANIISSKKNPGAPRADFLVLSTPQYIKGAAWWVHVVCAWAINIIVAFFLWRNYVAVTRLRRQYFESTEYLTALHSRTLMLTDIPSASRTDEGILRLTDVVEQTSGLPRAAIARNVKELPELIEEHDKVVKELEVVLAKYLKNPDNLPANRPTITPSRKYRKNNGGQKVDAIDYLTDRIGELEMEIKHVRESIDKRNPMPFGFASYERIEDAHTVAYAAKKKHPQGTTIRMAPRPNDLIWKNLPLTKKDRNWKRFINNFWIAILTLIWIAPNALIAIFLSNLNNLANIWGGFKKEFLHHSTIWSIVQGIASPALTSLVYLILPIIFRRLSIHAGDTTKTSRERHVVTKLYAFFVFNNLVVFSTFSVISTYITFVVKDHQKEGVWDAIKKGDILTRLVYGLCQVSPFWLTWLLQRNLGAAADLAQVLNLTWGWFNRKFMSPTPRQTIEWTAPPAMDYAVYYNYFLFYATVALCFVTIQPLVIPVTAFYFAVDYWLKKYLLLYVLVTKTESGGQYWRILFNRFIFATIFADIVIAVVLQWQGSWVMLGVMAPLPLLLIGFKIYCASTFDDQNDFYTRAALKDPEGLTDAGHKARKNDRVGTKFGHPALYSKLITPMVHAKAQHVLGQVYRGRLNPENNMSAPDGYSDIAMDPMSRDVPGKAARFAPEQQKQKDMFEVVPEAHLDFGYFKDRTDFAEEHGGDGELYGRPQDLVSERSSTPRSFMGRDGGSSSSSRASSPGTEAGFGRQSPQELRQMHPAYRDHSRQSSAGRGNLYTNGNESERNLLSGAQPVGTTENEEQYGLDRWRTGGSGYIGVPQGEETGYEAYRGRGR